MNQKKNSIIWAISIIGIIVILAGIQWWQISRNAIDVASVGNSNYSSSPITTITNTPIINQSTTTTMNTVKNFAHTVTLETNKGTIVFETYDADAPKAAGNFVKLAQSGFYDGVGFHRVIKGFMIQGGDPLTKDPSKQASWGTGGPGYQFADELDPSVESYKAGYVRGMVAMANAGPNTNGSQFFIMHQDYGLPHNYTIFGKVLKGMEVVDAIANTKVAPGDRPLDPIVMKKVTVQTK